MEGDFDEGTVLETFTEQDTRSYSDGVQSPAQEFYLAIDPVG